jgi:hypothetical protein
VVVVVAMKMYETFDKEFFLYGVNNSLTVQGRGE